MEAITWNKKQPPVVIDYARCIGCGLCVIECDKEKAMSLRERPSYSPPSETVLDYYADRYLEINGKGNLSLGPRLQLGLGRLLAKLSPVSVSGPGYKPR
jgi:ferredoxin